MNAPIRTLAAVVALSLVAATTWLIALGPGDARPDPVGGKAIADERGHAADTDPAPDAELVRRQLAVEPGVDDAELLHLRGRIVDAYGDSVGGALVGEVRSDRPVIAAADGRFEVLAVRGESPIELLVIADGYAPMVSAHEVSTARGAHAGGDIRVLHGGSVRGRITDAAGAGLIGATVTLQPRSVGSWPPSLDLGELLSPTTAAADGIYAFSHLVPGAYRIVASHRGMQFGSSRTLTVRDCEETTVEPIALAVGHDLAGCVLGPSDEPLAGAVVRIRNASNQPRYDQRIETTADGRFRLGALPPGPLRVEVARSGYLRFQRDDVDATRGEELIVRLAAGLSVGGTVVDARRGQPVERFAAAARRIGDVEPASNGTMEQQLARRIGELRAAAADAGEAAVRDQQLRIASQLEARLARVRSEARSRPIVVPADVGEPIEWPAGRFWIDGLEEGIYAIGIASPGHPYAQSEPIELRRGIPPPELRFELTDGHALSGRVIAKRDRDPVAGATVELVRITDSPAAAGQLERSLYSWVFARPAPSGVIVMVTRTAGDGRFAFAEVAPGSYFLSVREARHTDHDTAAFDIPGDRRELRIEVGARAQLRGRIANVSPGDPVEVSVLILGGYGTMRTVKVDPDGTYHCEGLQPGSYLVRAFPADAERYVSRLLGSLFPLHAGPVDPEPIPDPDVTLAEGEARRFDPVIDLPAAGVVRGDVSINGQPGGGALILLRPVPGEAPGSGGLSLRATCDDRGAFTIADVPAGEYRLLLLSAMRQELHVEPVTITPNATAFAELEVRAGGLRGRVAAHDAPSLDELRGYVWVLPGATEIPADLYDYRRANRTHRLAVRDGVFEDLTLTPGPAVLVLDLRGRRRTSTTVDIPVPGVLEIDLRAGERLP